MSLEKKLKEQQKIILEQQETILRLNGIITKQQELILEQKNEIKDINRGLGGNEEELSSLASSSDNILSKESQLKRITELERKLKEQEEIHEKNLKQVIKEKLESVRELQKRIDVSKIKDWQKIVSEKDEKIREQEKKLKAVRIHIEKLKDEWAEKETYIEQLEEDASKFKKLEKSQNNIIETEEKLKKMEEVWKQKIREKDKRIKELESLLKNK